MLSASVGRTLGQIHEYGYGDKSYGFAGSKGLSLVEVVPIDLLYNIALNLGDACAEIDH